MSLKNNFNGFKFEFGSNVTILTTAALGTYHGKKISKGIFTGVVLDETQLKFDRAQKYVSVHAVGTFGDECHEPDKVQEQDIYEKYHELKEKECGENKPEQDKEKHGHHEKKEKEKYLVLSLTHPSFPYRPGQIVYIHTDQIVAVSIECANFCNKC